MGAVDRSEHTDETAACVIQFINSSKEPVRCFWVDFKGVEMPYALLDKGHSTAQSTFDTHLWRVRLEASGTLVGQYMGQDTVFEAHGAGRFTTRPLQLVAPPKPEWGEWAERGHSLGVSIWAYSCVGQQAVDIAAYLIRRMLEHSPQEVVHRLQSHKARVGIIARCQVTTDIPDHAFLKLSKGGRDLDTTARGLGGTMACPMATCGEENLTMVDDSRYSMENILIHEFGHTVMNVGLTQAERDEIKALYDAAKSSGSYSPGIYMMENEDEYWAEGSQSWFHATARCDVNDGITTRDALRAHDPGLAAMLCRVYGDGPWRYTHDCPAPFKPKGKSKLAAAGGSAGAHEHSDGGGQQGPGEQAALVAPGSHAGGMQRSRMGRAGGLGLADALCGGCAGNAYPGLPFESCLPRPVMSGPDTHSSGSGIGDGASGGGGYLMGLAAALNLGSVYAMGKRVAMSGMKSS